MNCQKVQGCLSAYHDGELAIDLHQQVAEHLEQCSQCAMIQESFAAISDLVSSYADTTASPPSWNQIDGLLNDAHRAQPVAVERSRAFGAKHWLAMAAVALLAVGIGYGINHGWHSHTSHEDFTAEFGQYLDMFEQNPAAAQQILLANYENRPVKLDDAVRHVGYRPLAADGLPAGYTAESTHVMVMPCCTCVQTLCKRDDGTMLAIFEHDDDAAPLWFGNRREVTASCGGRECCLVDVDEQIAATWKQGSRYVTLIGVRDVEEVTQFVAALDQQPPPLVKRAKNAV